MKPLIRRNIQQKTASFLLSELLFPAIVLILLWGLKDASQRQASEPQLWMSQTKKMMSEGKFAEAASFNQHLIDMFPQNHIYLQRAAEIYAHLSNPHGEAEMLERFFKTSPDPSEACPRLANLYHQMGDTEKMLDAAERCHQLEPHNFDLLFQVALANERASHLGKALQIYADGFRRQPGYIDFVIGHARVLVLLKKGRAAYNEIKAVLKTHPQLVDAQVVTALAAIRLKKWDEARALIQAGLNKDPNSADFQSALTRLKSEAESK